MSLDELVSRAITKAFANEVIPVIKEKVTEQIADTFTDEWIKNELDYIQENSHNFIEDVFKEYACNYVERRIKELDGRVELSDKNNKEC